MTRRIALEGLEFHSFHGVYPHERESGNFFEVDIAVEANFLKAALQDDLTATIDYEILFQIVKEEMSRPSKLLETVAEKIVDDVFKKFATVSLVEFKISKLNPPIGGKCRKATVTITKQRTV